MRHITLLTDFGTTEGEHTVMKGVIWRILPNHPIADLSHDVSPQNIREAALILERTAHYFPDETVHTVVVDPGVGTSRRAIAARFGNQFFVGPDNGVCTPLYKRASQHNAPIDIVHLDNASFWLEAVSPIFHGRDIFAPCAAHLASGVPLDELGTPITDIIFFEFQPPIVSEDRINGQVYHIDHFGNVITNIRRDDIPADHNIIVQLAGVELIGLVNTFGDKPIGSSVVLYSPNNYLMISVVNGNAADRLAVNIDEPVEVLLRRDQD